MKLGLGTVQFGQAYGLANKNNRVKKKDVSDMLTYAREHNIDLLDTAVDYGNCESVLGQSGVKSFSIVTKLPGLPDMAKNMDCWVKDSLAQSRLRLGQEKLYGLLLHRPEDLLSSNGEALYRALTEEKQAGHISKLGVSIYSPVELELIIQRFKIDLVQVPCNVLDRRLINSGWLKKLKDCGVEVHVRSAFLQGLLLMPSLPEYFNRWGEEFTRWHQWLETNQIDPVDACLTFLKQVPGLDRIIVGAVNVEQLAHIETCFQRQSDYVLPNISTEDEALIIPSNWVLA